MGKVVVVTLPDIGEGVVEGEVVEWLKNVGDSIAQDEPVVVVMTDKATVELPSPHPGVLLKQHYALGDTAYLGKPLYEIETEIEVPKKAPSKEKKVKKAVHTPAKAQGKVLATPPVRQLAKSLGIDLSTLKGTGPDGRITIEDLKAPSKMPFKALPGDEVTPVAGVKGMMAKKMAEAKRIAPHFSYFEQVEATRLVKLRETFKKEGAKEGLAVTYMPFFIRALSLTIHSHPEINSVYDEERRNLILHKQHNIGIATMTPEGLIVPVLREVEKMSLEEIIRSYQQLREKIESNTLKPADFQGSTITISNFGAVADKGRWATPILNTPEVAILAVAKIQKQPVVKNDQVVVQEMLNLSWSFDHRVIDGDLAAAASHDFAGFIRNPAQLL